MPQRESVDWDFPVSVLDVVLMGTYGRLGWFARPGQAERQWARECLDKVGLVAVRAAADRPAFRRPAAAGVSGPALAQQAEIYFMDEPMAGVDAATERIIFELLRELRQQGKTVIAVHHDLRTVPQYFD